LVDFNSFNAQVPPNYVVKDFGPRALQHSKVDFDWDDDDPFRKRTLRRKFTDELVSTALAYGKYLMVNMKNGVKYNIVKVSTISSLIPKFGMNKLNGI